VYVKRQVDNPRHAIYGPWVAVESAPGWASPALCDEELADSVVIGTLADIGDLARAAEIEQLQESRERDQARTAYDTVESDRHDDIAKVWRYHHETLQNLNSSRPAISADAVVLPDDWETQIRQALAARAYDISEAGPLPGTSSHDRDADRCADEIAGDIVVLINDWMSAPVSGSDTTGAGA
jgi:hypothetical protein